MCAKSVWRYRAYHVGSGDYPIQPNREWGDHRSMDPEVRDRRRMGEYGLVSAPGLEGNSWFTACI